jgi:hypothetical protein
MVNFNVVVYCNITGVFMKPSRRSKNKKKYKTKIQRVKQVKIGILYLYNGSTISHCLKLTATAADKSWQSKALNPALQRQRHFEGGRDLS